MSKPLLTVFNSLRDVLATSEANVCFVSGRGSKESRLSVCFLRSLMFGSKCYVLTNYLTKYCSNYSLTKLFS